jgi:hypothetical protein
MRARDIMYKYYHLKPAKLDSAVQLLERVNGKSLHNIGRKHTGLIHADQE